MRYSFFSYLFVTHINTFPYINNITMAFIDDINKILNEKPKPDNESKMVHFIGGSGTKVSETLNNILLSIVDDKKLDNLSCFIKKKTKYNYFINKPIGEMSYLFHEIFDCWIKNNKNVKYRLFYDNEFDNYIFCEHNTSTVKDVFIYCNPI